MSDYKCDKSCDYMNVRCGDRPEERCFRLSTKSLSLSSSHTRTIRSCPPVACTIRASLSGKSSATRNNHSRKNCSWSQHTSKRPQCENRAIHTVPCDRSGSTKRKKTG